MNKVSLFLSVGAEWWKGLEDPAVRLERRRRRKAEAEEDEQDLAAEMKEQATKGTDRGPTRVSSGESDSEGDMSPQDRRKETDNRDRQRHPNNNNSSSSKRDREKDRDRAKNGDRDKSRETPKVFKPLDVESIEPNSSMNSNRSEMLLSLFLLCLFVSPCVSGVLEDQHQQQQQQEAGEGSEEIL